MLKNVNKEIEKIRSKYIRQFHEYEINSYSIFRILWIKRKNYYDIKYYSTLLNPFILLLKSLNL